MRSEEPALSDAQTTPGLLFVLVGPPGVGKNALMNIAFDDLDNLSQLATATTRSIRATEQEGREHVFVSMDKFRQMIEDDDLVEWQQVHLNLYGIPRQTLEEAFTRGHDLAADIDVLGATFIRSLYPRNVVLIFIEPPSIDELENRMRQRGEPEGEIAKRMKRVAMEMTYAPLCDYVIVNDELEHAAADLKRIIQTERVQRFAGQAPAVAFRHQVEVIAVCDDAVLYHPTADHFPQADLNPGEIPHKAAQRILQQQFAVEPDMMQRYVDAENPHHGSFIPPVRLDVRGQGSNRDIIFTYIVLLAQQIPPPPGWAWQSQDAVRLDPDMRELLLAQPELSPGD